MRFEPEQLPITDDPRVLAEAMQRQLYHLTQVLEAISTIQLDELNVEPDKPQEGMIKLADGTNWDPGSGAGFYGYQNGAWTFLG